METTSTAVLNSCRSRILAGKSVFVRLPFTEKGRGRLSCLTLDPSTWDPTVKGLRSVVFSDCAPLDLSDIFYIVNSGKVLGDDCALEPGREYLVQCRVLGGKGGFGSLLRSFGSQISKNRNQDACRDLSGRRIRNVKAEKRVKEYVEKQAEKEKERKKKKEEKLLKLKTTLETKPKHNFNDPEYEAERKRIPDKIFSAVEEGLRVVAAKPFTSAQTVLSTASTSKVADSFDGSREEIIEKVTVSTVAVAQIEKKRKHEDPMVNNMGSKRMKGWLGVDDDSDDSE